MFYFQTTTMIKKKKISVNENFVGTLTYSVIYISIRNTGFTTIIFIMVNRKHLD